MRGLTSSSPTPQDSQPQSTLAANSDSFWIFPHLTQVDRVSGQTGPREPADGHRYLAMDWRTVDRPSGDLSFLRKTVLSSCKLT